jgi:hypothetical protein
VLGAERITIEPSASPPASVAATRSGDAIAIDLNAMIAFTSACPVGLRPANSELAPSATISSPPWRATAAAEIA